MATQSTDVDLNLVSTDISGYIYGVIQSTIIEIDGDYTIEREQYIAPDIDADLEIAQEVSQEIEASIDIAIDFEYEFPADLYVSSILDKTFYGDIDIIGTQLYDIESTFTIYEVPEAEPMLLADDGISLAATNGPYTAFEGLGNSLLVFFYISSTNSYIYTNAYYDSSTTSFVVKSSSNEFEVQPNIDLIAVDEANISFSLVMGTTSDGRLGYYSDENVGSISPNTFEYGGYEYTITSIGALEKGGNVYIHFCESSELIKEPPVIDIESDVTIKAIKQSFSTDISIPNVLNYDLAGILDVIPCKVADIDSVISVDNKFVSYQDIDSDINVINNICIADIDSNLSIAGSECCTDLSCTAYIFNTKYKDLDGNLIIEQTRIQSYTFIC